MKKLLIISLILFASAFMQAQESGLSGAEKQRHFHAGISYTFHYISMDVANFSAHSIWYGEDLGTYTSNDDEIARMNEVRSDVSVLNALAVQVGAVLLDKPDGSWFVDASLLLGVGKSITTTELDQPSMNEMTSKTELKNPIAGLSVNLRYDFNANWGITLVPELFYTWGNAKSITDSIHPMTHFFTNDLKEDFSNGYGRAGLMASYTVKRLTVSAGPGFYYARMKKTYNIIRTNPEDGNEFYDELNTTLESKSFIDGCLRADWTFIDAMTLSVQLSAGKDLFINTGIRYNF